MRKVYPTQIYFRDGRQYLTTDIECLNGEIVEFSGSIYITGWAKILYCLGWHWEFGMYTYSIELIQDNLTLIEKLAEVKALI